MVPKLGHGLILIFLLGIVCSVSAQGDCKVDGINLGGAYTSVEINDTDIGLIKSYATKNLKKISYSNDPYTYAKIEYNDNDLMTLTLTDSFKEYEETQSDTKFMVIVKLECVTGEFSLRLEINIIDSNNHKPFFVGKDDFTYTIIVPAGKGTPIVPLYGELGAQDYDLTNDGIDFDLSNNELFTIKQRSVGGDKKKVYYATLELAKPILEMSDPMKLTVFAKDKHPTGDVVKEANITILIKPDPDVQIPMLPKFDKTFYSGTYKDGNLKIDDIKIIKGFDKTVSFGIVADSLVEKYITFESTENVATIKLKNGQIPDVDLEGVNNFLFSFKASKTDVEDVLTTIFIAIPKDSSRLQFETPSYEGTYSGTGVIIDGIKIIREDTSGIQFQLTGESDNYFDYNFLDDTISIIVKESIPDEILDKNSKLVLILTAEAKAGSASAAIIINIPPKTPPIILQFDKTYYNGEYSFENNALSPIVAVLVEQYENIDFVLTGEYDTYFDTSDQGKNVNIIKKLDIPESILQETKLITLSLNAIKNGAISAVTVINIDLIAKKESTKTLHFEETHYNGNYEFETNTLIPITASLTEEIEDVNYSLIGDYNNYFIYVKDGNKNVQIVFQDKIPEDVLQKTKLISLTLKADKTNTVSTFTVINIQLISKSDPDIFLNFEKTYYNGKYEMEGHSLSEIVAVLTDDYDQLKLDISGEYVKFFDYSRNSKNINIIKKEDTNLPDNILDTTNLLSFTLTASRIGAISAFTIINIELVPNKESTKTLHFEETHYNGNYEFETNTLIPITASLTEEIEDVNFSLIGDNSDYFRYVKDGKKNVQIVLQDKIPEDVLQKTKLISLTLKADKTNTVSTFTVINIQLISKSDPDIFLNFEKTYYNGKYKMEDHSLSEIVAVLTDEYDQITLDISGDYSNLFDYSRSSKNIIIIKKKDSNLPDDILDTTNLLSLTLTASKTGAISAFTIINVELISKKESPNTLKFENSHYNGIYEFETNTLSPIVASLTEEDDDVSFNIAGENSQYFDCEKDGRKNVKIVKKIDIPESVVQKIKLITLTLIASKDDSVSGYTVINVQLISNIDTTINLTFEETYYNGKYDFNTNTLTEISAILVENHMNVSYNLSGEHVDYFDYTVDDKVVTIIKKSNISDSVTTSLISLTLEANKKNALSTFTIINVLLINGKATTTFGFKERHYIGVYNADNQTLSPIVAELTEDHDDITVDFEGSFGYLFNYTKEGQFIHIYANSPDKISMPHNLLSLNLKVTKNDAIPAYTVINVVIESITELEKNSIKFKKSIYEGTYSINDEINLSDDIILENQFFNLTEVTWIFEGDTNNSLSLKVSEDSRKLTIEGKLNPGDTDEKLYITFVIRGTHPDIIIGSTVVIIELPEKDANTTMKFEHPLYLTSYSYLNDNISEMNISFTGFNDKVNFTFSNDFDKYLKADYISKDQKVVVTVKKPLPWKLLTDTPFVSTELRANTLSAIAFTIISFDLNWKNDPLTIKEINEGEAKSALFGIIPRDGCSYKVDTIPEKQGWFYLDEKGMLCANSSIDREDDTIAFMHLSQVQLELSIVCDDDDAVKRPIIKNTPSLFENTDKYGRYCVLTKDIEYSRNKQFLTVVVNDVNDNPPIFDSPNPLTLGYPTKELSYILKPRQLITVKATDADIDLNAKIRYSDDSDMFTIHPETGVIYPKGDVFAHSTDTLSFKISATDEDGMGKQTDLNIKVLALKTEHIAVLTVQNATIENVENIVSHLSYSINCTIRVISDVVLPADTASTYKELKQRISKTNLRAETTASLSIIIYGLDDKSQLVENTYIISQVNAADVPWKIDAIELPESELFVTNVTQESYEGLVIGISVLGALFFVTIVGVILFYIFFIRRRYRKFSNSSSVSSNSSDSVDDEDNISMHSKDEKKIEKFDVNTDKEPNNNFLHFDDIVNSPSSTRENISIDHEENEFGETVPKNRKKSNVTFNEKVLQFDIETYDEKL